MLKFLFPMTFLDFFKHNQLQSCQNRLHYHYLHTKLSNDYKMILIYTHEALLCMPLSFVLGKLILK